MKGVLRAISSACRAHRRVLQRTAVLACTSGVAWYAWHTNWSSEQPSIFQLRFSVQAAARLRDHPINVTAEIVEKAAPAVVSIISEQKIFGMRQPMSSGSGFIVRSDGLILTNAHVVARSRVVRIQLQDGREFDGVVHAVDPVTDLATVKIPKISGLPVLTLGDSDALRAGEWVAAIGSPLSLSNTVTAGIVSTVHRTSDDLGIGRRGREYGHGMSYIQTDATITFGNSGGPLVNVEGEAIGINTMKIESGISFAIPANYARRFLDKVEAASKEGGPDESVLTRRLYVGIEMLSLSGNILQELRSRIPDFPNVSGGVYIHRVAPNSPASSAGLQSGDVIVEANKRPVRTANELYDLVNSSSKEIVFSVVRKQEVLSMRVVPEIPDE